MHDQGCTHPPEGWSCGRTPGHDGPCLPFRTPQRPSKEEMFLQIAEVVATRSTCNRLAVGAVVTDWDMTTAKSLGYNGNARGLPNGCDTETPGACGCLHAEDNALLKAPYENTGPLVLFCTHNPCLTCAKRILNTRIIKVIYRNEYRRVDGIILLRENGVTPVHLPAP
jgi:dCMP deaminase